MHARALLIRSAFALGHKVLVVTPPPSRAEDAALAALGVERAHFEMRPSALPFVEAWRLKSDLLEAIRSWRPSGIIVSGYELAEAGAQAARQAGVGRIVTMVTDLGADGRREEDERASAYAGAVCKSTAVIVHNTSDEAVLRRSGALSSTRAVLTRLPGGGAALDVPAPPIPALDDGPVLAMVIDGKRPEVVSAFTTAAKALRRAGKRFRAVVAFDPLGADEGAPIMIDGVDLAEPGSAPTDVVAGAHVLVHLTEEDGLSPRLIEALGLGRAILTLDQPGVRETVDDCVNGCLASSVTPDAIASAMGHFIARPELIPIQCQASRAKAERSFDARKVGDTLLALLEP
ncbi:MAG: glycosyltransferase [Hyphomicrobium sp.]|nr:glycosyltransferase [Hyphomicrobium sp.]